MQSMSRHLMQKMLTGVSLVTFTWLIVPHLSVEANAEDMFRKSVETTDTDMDGLAESTKVTFYQGDSKVAVSLERRKPNAETLEAMAFFLYYEEKCVYAEVQVFDPTKAFIRSFRGTSEVDVIITDDDKTLVTLDSAGTILYGFKRDINGRLGVMSGKEFSEVKETGPALKQFFSDEL